MSSGKSAFVLFVAFSIALQSGCYFTNSETSDDVKSKQEKKQQQQDKTKKTGQSKTLAPLIAVDGLKKILGDDKVCIIELGSDQAEFDKGHIEGARFVHWVNDITDLNEAERYNITSKSSFEKLLSRLGIEHDSHIILYDDFNSRLSTRMFWTLKYYGHPQVQVLDGGKGLWAKSQALTKNKTTIKASKYVIEKVRNDIKIDMKTIASDLQSRRYQLLDGRPAEQYTGEKPGKVYHTGTPHKKKGHIPGAVNICWKENFNEDGTFKSAAELKKLYEKRGIKPQRATVTYCNEGLHAAPPWFVLTELLGAENVKLYDDSMCEWANSDKPVVKSKK